MKPLFQPVHPFVITQGFGENKICVDLATGRNVIGCDGLNPPPGYRSLYGPKGHTGVDLLTKHGQPVVSASGGVVESIDTQPRSGLDVRVVFTLDGIKHRVIYEHLLGYQVKVGDVINFGDLIGWADNTGYSSGDHLHFSLERVEGSKRIYLDPLQFMNPVYALDAAPVISRLKEVMAQVIDLLSDMLRKKKNGPSN